MAGGKAASLQQHKLVKTIEKIVVLADALTPPKRIRGCQIGAGSPARPEINATGIKRLETLKRSATIKSAWFGSIMPPEPTRMFWVTAAIWPIMMSGAELAIAGKL